MLRAGFGIVCRTKLRVGLTPLPPQYQVLFQYPEGKDALNPVSITLGDLRRLRGGQFLNDNLVDFWLKRSVNGRAEAAVAAAEAVVSGGGGSDGGDGGGGGGGGGEDNEAERLLPLPKSVHVFGSQFYTKLTERPKGYLSCPPPGTDDEAGRARHWLVRKWTKSMNVFAHDFLLVPIAMSLHWSMAVVCYPGRLLELLGLPLDKGGGSGGGGATEATDGGSNQGEEKDPDDANTDSGSPCVLEGGGPPPVGPASKGGTLQDEDYDDGDDDGDDVDDDDVRVEDVVPFPAWAHTGALVTFDSGVPGEIADVIKHTGEIMVGTPPAQRAI